MLGLRVHFEDHTRRVKRRARKGNIRSLGHAGGAIRKAARKLIRSRKDRRRHAPPGHAPFTHGGLLRRAIFYHVDEIGQRCVIGPTAELIGDVAAAHEHGGSYKGAHYPRRPFMSTALEEIKPRLPRHWAGMVR